MFFVIPEMPSKTFVMVLKKLPDHFKDNMLMRIQAGDPVARYFSLDRGKSPHTVGNYSKPWELRQLVVCTGIS